MKSVHFDDLKQSGCRCNGFHGFAHQSEKTQLVRIGFQKISYLGNFRGKQLFADFLFCSLAWYGRHFFFQPVCFCREFHAAPLIETLSFSRFLTLPPCNGGKIQYLNA